MRGPRCNQNRAPTSPLDGMWHVLLLIMYSRYHSINCESVRFHAQIDDQVKCLVPAGSEAVAPVAVALSLSGGTATVTSTTTTTAKVTNSPVDGECAAIRCRAGAMHAPVPADACMAGMARFGSVAVLHPSPPDLPVEAPSAYHSSRCP